MSEDPEIKNQKQSEINNHKVPPSSKSILESNKNVKETSVSKEQITEEFSNCKYNGDLLLRELSVVEASEAQSMMIVMIVVMLRWIAIILIKTIDINEIKHSTFADYYILLWIVGLNVSLHLINVLFVLTGILDFGRKLFYQKILGALLDPQRHFNDPPYIKLIPSINITWYHNIRRWMFLRKVSLDLGKKFTLRVFLYSSVFLGMYGLMAVFFTLSFFNLLSYNVPIAVSVLGYFDVIFILGIIMKMLSIGAETNSYFVKHKGILLKLKRHFIEIKLRYNILEEKAQFKSETLKILVERFKDMNFNEEKRREHIENWIQAIDYIVENLDYDSENDCLKLLGIKCTNELMNSIYTGLMSLCLAGGQYIYSQKFQ